MLAKELNITKLAALFIATLFAYFCLIDQYRAVVDACACTDAFAYTQIGKIYERSGIVQHLWSDLRLYAYPLFISIVNRASRPLSIEPHLALFATQLLIYYCSVGFLARVMSNHVNRSAGNIVFFSLITNIFIYPNLVISLTDGISVCIFICIATVAIKAAAANRAQGIISSKLGWITLSGALVGIAVMVRPANLYLSLVPICLIFFSCKSMQSGRFMSLSLNLAGALLGFIAVVTPQVAFNYDTYNSLTFLPTYDLRAAQIKFGIEFIKYATNLSGGSPQLAYLNPWVTEPPAGMIWYLTNPWSGFKTALLHIFSAVDFDYLFVYVYDIDPWYRPLLFLYSHTIIFWGVRGFILASSTARAELKHSAGDNSTTLAALFIIMFPLLAAGWAAMHLFTAVENRFALPVITMFLPLAMWCLFIKQRVGRKGSVSIYALFAAYLAGAWWISSFIGTLKVVR